MMKLKIIFVLLLFLPAFVNAQDYDWVKFDSLLITGINQIYSLEFNKAEKTFDIVEKDYPTHPAGKFFKAMITWWKILVDLENESYDNKFFSQLESVIDMCNNILDKNPKNADAIFYKGGALGFRGRLRAIRESWFKAALDGKEALPLVFKAYELNPNNIDLQLGFGIYNYYAEVIPEKYPAVKPFMIFFPKGDKNKGLKQLENVAFNGRYAKIESRYFLMTIYFQYEDDMVNARKYAELLVKQFPNNPVFEKYYGTIFVKNNDYISAEKIFRDILIKSQKNYTGYNLRFEREATYYIGMYFKLANRPDSTAFYFQKCVDISKKVDKDEESGFQINATLYLAMAYDQLGLREKAVKYYNDVLNMKERGDSHSQAEKYLKIPYK
ncbi:tetratricopeptide repeat protein [Melioribacteraceae bacterium 4301-Me]|uniref:tetratricopeptide repeat protein n=1 Tax=Pyranulibacter aquaticus TaxID=3163344 RepID=UPI0035971568